MKPKPKYPIFSPKVKRGIGHILVFLKDQPDEGDLYYYRQHRQFAKRHSDIARTIEWLESIAHKEAQ